MVVLPGLLQAVELLELRMSDHTGYCVSLAILRLMMVMLTVNVTLIRHRRYVYALILDILQHIRFIPRIGLFLLLVDFGMNHPEHDVQKYLTLSIDSRDRDENILKRPSPLKHLQ